MTLKSGQGNLPTSVAGLIDISAVRTDSTEHDIEELVRLAEEWGFASAHVLPHWIGLAMSKRSTGGHLKVGAPVGFPTGAVHTVTKLRETEAVLSDGVDEIDVVANTARLLSADAAYVTAELKEVLSLVGGVVTTRVIFESHYLDEKLLRTACDIAVEVGADFIKTGTGWAPTGATLETIRILADQAKGRIEIKAAGGVRELDVIAQMVELGVSRFGINVADAIRLVELDRARQ